MDRLLWPRVFGKDGTLQHGQNTSSLRWLNVRSRNLTRKSHSRLQRFNPQRARTTSYAPYRVWLWFQRQRLLLSFRRSERLNENGREALQDWPRATENPAHEKAEPSSATDAKPFAMHPTCRPWPPSASTPTSRRNTLTFGPPENPQKSPWPPSCENSLNPQTSKSRLTDCGSQTHLAHDGYSVLVLK